MNEECLICKAPLTYLEADILMECEICHKKENSKTRCVNGHYVCNECHTRGLDRIIALCMTSASRDPIAIIEQMMALPTCHMHGPEHHVMVGAALLTAYHNAGGDIDLRSAIDGDDESRTERSRRRLRLLGYLRCGDQHGDVCVHHFAVYAANQ